MNSRTSELRPGFRRTNMSEIKGIRTSNSVTFNPSKASPKEDIYVSIPKLRPDVCIVPDTLRLAFSFTNKNTKSWFKNNLGNLLCEQLTVKVGGEIVYDNRGESRLEIYKDLWKSEIERGNMIEYGIADENTRKLLSKDDSGNKANNHGGGYYSDTYMDKIFRGELRIKLGKILNDHGLYAPYEMNSDVEYNIRLPDAEDIMIAQSGESVAGYELENIRLEYETVENAELAKSVSEGYEVGRSLSFEHVTLMKTTDWVKDLTLVNETINLPRKSMKAIVLLFTDGTNPSSENFEFPDITNVKITIEGVPNSVYSRGISVNDFFSEAKRVFGIPGEHNMEIRDFYWKYFAFVIDLRTVDDGYASGSGRKLLNTQSGVLMEISKIQSAKDLKCHIYVISDGLINIVNKRLQTINY